MKGRELELLGALADCIKDLACLVDPGKNSYLAVRLNSVYQRAEGVLESCALSDDPYTQS